MNDSTGVILGALTLLLFVIVYVWYALALAAVFAKTGEATWKAWVPVVNLATVLKLGGFSPWLVLLILIPLFGAIAFAVVLIVAIHRVTLGFGRGPGMTVLGAFIPMVWASILGFGRARWTAEAAPGVRRSGVDENSAPVRRGQDFAGPYVPLVGGWTPEPPTPTGVEERKDAETPEPASEPIPLPFAAISPSLSDVPPAPPEWAPPTIPDASTPRDEVPGATPAPTPEDGRSSVSEVLAALRAPRAGERSVDPGAAVSTPSAAAPDAEAWDVGLLTPAAPGRVRPVVPSDSPAEPDASAPVAGLPPLTAEEDEPRLASWRAPSLPDEDAAGADEPLTRPAPVSAVPARTDDGPGEEFPELSGAVSAVPDAPQAGAPRSARTSVSALYTQPEFPVDPDDDIDALDRTVVTRRRRIPWALVPPNGVPIDLTSDVVILGRRPSADAAHPDAQLVPIADETRTVSKTHARLQLRGDTWYVTDLDSTNGVLFATLMGTEVEAPPGEEIEAGERFFLGDAEVRLTRSEP
ncbi:DUF5684 domain-containing protein [Microbacterium sp. 1P10AE]|uniref:DUF5684 domain-containing protein n=1 Tax=Microbacterium sp. 1P10AE TaxID=3132286 RepID=UPI0039A30E61